ncbi:PqiC family protein [Roseisalinus antarcticus]|uniref:ABC-type transport auxiliary lipoprotein component domain-containing protein n=1 Tax=Roseisalinus antarcticus TaxID=254357 RepID=A0A1Y5TNL0_9RHOB|nr:ABC-type transport auxiliary lipoprotein family protein [Roseisalinus antarcticus]SLN68179.1 hypothetical protein ROA7023_03299 [Roseisalinus antarcticus]
MEISTSLKTAAILAAVLLGGCAKEVRYTVPQAEPEVRVASIYSSVEVVEVTLPDYAAAEDIYLLQPDGGISALGPLWADDPARAVTLQLSRDLGAIIGRNVAPEPWPFRSFADARLDVRMEEFVATSNGTFRIAGQYFVAPESGGRDRAGQFSIEVPLAAQDSPGAIAAARSQAVATLAAQVARNGLR